MAVEGCYEPQRPDSLQLKETMCDFDRRLIGHQSLDSFQCLKNSSHTISKQCREGLSKHFNCSDENLSSMSRLSLNDEDWMSSQTHQQYQECSVSDSLVGSEDLCECTRTRVSKMSYSSGSAHSAPVTPSSADVIAQRHCTKLNVEPSPHYRGLQEPARPYTSVNLTLRPPSSNPQPPIDISSRAGGLTYSSCSYDPRQGYQSRLQISIGPGGEGTVTGARTQSIRPCSSVPFLRPALSMPDVATTSSQLSFQYPLLVSNGK